MSAGILIFPTSRPSARPDAVLHGRLEGLGAHGEQLLRTFAALLSLAPIEAGALGPRPGLVIELDLPAAPGEAGGGGA